MTTMLHYQRECVLALCVHASACRRSFRTLSRDVYRTSALRRWKRLFGRVLRPFLCRAMRAFDAYHSFVLISGCPSCFLAMVMVLLRSGLTLATSFQ